MWLALELLTMFTQSCKGLFSPLLLTILPVHCVALESLTTSEDLKVAYGELQPLLEKELQKKLHVR